MKKKLIKILKHKKVIILMIALLVAVFFINPSFDEGVVIRSVAPNSVALDATPEPLVNPPSNLKPRQREVIQEFNGVPINQLSDFFDVVEGLEPNQSVTLLTNRNVYFFETRPQFDNETGEVIGVEDLGIQVAEKARNNVRQGLDLAGGTRVLIEPQGELTSDQMSILLNGIEQRLNIFGVADVTVTTANDLFGNVFILVEIGGVNEDEIRNILSQQGVFEAMIGNETVFRGGDRDVVYVCRSAECSGITPGTCGEVGPDQFTCGFNFAITLRQEAAQRQADITRDLDVIRDGFQSSYLSENLTFILDGQVVNELRIAGDLRGNAVTNIQISGSGVGTSQEAAREDAIANMRQMQTVLLTGSLPVELNIVKVDNISPAVGSGFIRNALLAGFLAILSVIITVSVRYREPKIALPMSITMLSEVIILLGVAAAINWNIDMAAIAAIIIAVGSGVDHQIVIADETIARAKTKNKSLSWAKRLAKAFFIIMAAYLTLVVAMVPLWFAGAGLLKGFALTTIIGVTAGVLITRPAFAAIMEIIYDE